MSNPFDAVEFAPTDLERNGPIIAKRMRDEAAIAVRGQAWFAAVALTHRDASNQAVAHRTLKAAFKSLASMCAGNRKTRDMFACAIVTPAGQVLNYREARARINQAAR